MFSTFRIIPLRVTRSMQIRNSSANEKQEHRLMHIEQQFNAVPPKERNKEAFMAAIAIFKERKSRSHVEFINSALKFIKEYGIHKDIETYKTLLNIFPKGKMIPQNTFQRIFLHYPMQQNCCVKVLDEMEWNGVQPDKEIHDIVVNAFGEWNFATKKIKRMLYWMPKLKHSNKYLDRRDIEDKQLSAAELGGLALKMMCRDPGTEYSLHKLKEDIIGRSSWIASAQSALQQKIVNQLPEGTEIFVDGPFNVWLMQNNIQYVQMTCRPISKPQEFKDESNDEDMSNWFTDWKKRMTARQNSLHEQTHETVLALAVFDSTNNRMASVWLEQLEKNNPRLSRMQPRLRLDISSDR